MAGTQRGRGKRAAATSVSRFVGVVEEFQKIPLITALGSRPNRICFTMSSVHRQASDVECRTELNMAIVRFISIEAEKEA